MKNLRMWVAMLVAGVFALVVTHPAVAITPKTTAVTGSGSLTVTGSKLDDDLTVSHIGTNVNGVSVFNVVDGQSILTSPSKPRFSGPQLMSGCLVTTGGGSAVCAVRRALTLTIRTRDGNDRAQLNTSQDILAKLEGGAGNDTLTGADGNAGMDQIFGGPGDDLVDGRGGRDLLIGGRDAPSAPGADTIIAQDGGYDLVECERFDLLQVDSMDGIIRRPGCDF